MSKVLYFLAAIIISLLSCSCNDNSANVENNITPTETFARGADVSWLPQMEISGFDFYDRNGNKAECLQILKDNGINSIRLRTWVNPSNDKTNGHCSKKETVEMAQRAKAMGFKLMIDFHYSDSWADPSKQNKPEAWEKLSFEELETAVYDYTFSVLDTLESVNALPDWVQIGNEIRGGLLFPDGKIENNDFSNTVALINSGAKAVRDISKNIKIIIHSENGSETEACTWFYDGICKAGADFDIIGVSYYPYWLAPEGHKDHKESLRQLVSNFKSWKTKYGKGVLVVETGGLDNYDANHEDDVYNMIADLIKELYAVDENSGVFYWEPQGEREWSGGYKLSCWQKDGRPTKALEAFKTR